MWKEMVGMGPKDKTREDQCLSQSAYTNRVASLHVPIL